MIEVQDEVQRKEAKRQEAEKADVQGLIHDVPEEDEDEEDKEEQEEQRKVLLDFAKQRDSNRPKENRKGKEVTHPSTYSFFGVDRHALELPSSLLQKLDIRGSRQTPGGTSCLHGQI